MNCSCIWPLLPCRYFLSMFSFKQKHFNFVYNLMSSSCLLYRGNFWYKTAIGSAIERCLLFLSVIKRFFYETMTMIPSVLRNSVCCWEVSAIKHVCYRGVPLYHYILNFSNVFLDKESKSNIRMNLSCPFFIYLRFSFLSKNFDAQNQNWQKLKT